MLRTYTTELLRPYWIFESLLQGFDLDLYEAPYGALLQEGQPGSGLLAHQPDVTCLFLRWEDIDPRFTQPLASQSAAQRRSLIDAATDQLAASLRRIRDAVGGRIVVTLLPRLAGPELGIHDTMALESEAEFHAALKHRLATQIRDALPAVLLDDLDVLMAEVGRAGLFDMRLWFSARFPFSVAGAQAVVRRLLVHAVLLKQPRAKCIVLDADNTLWGGIVGEDGPAGIALGPDYPGSAYVAFQRRLRDYQQRGFVLALCSKNNPQDVEQVLAEHPHQVLRAADFAARQVNWLSKPENLRAIATELNLGLDALVFVDNNIHECFAVRQALPQVTVVRTPAEPAELPSCLDELPQLEIASLTDEDRKRTQLYAQEQQRRNSAVAGASLEQYLASLDMTMIIGIDDARQAVRIAQLTQKTNQFNLTTRRYTEAQVCEFIADPGCLVAYFSLVDIFGDSGIVGVAIVRGVATAKAEIDSFLMSCRVIGRRAETVFVRALLRRLAARGVSRVRASFLPTAKNGLVKSFWPEHGFQPDASGSYVCELTPHACDEMPEVPIRVTYAEPAVEPAIAEPMPVKQ